ncbi:MAG TPA: hypothetical protein VK421_10905 [Pyrinomonadaceae bacterium]|nr:hypothetical protein [Pyrinomonadaceae bacterium]
MRVLYGTGKTAALTCAALCLAAATEGAALAQRGRELGAARRQEHMNRQAAEHERENLNRDLDPAAAGAAGRKRTQAATAQVKHDFESLQAGYNRIVLALTPKRAAEAADSLPAAIGEVHKCATRLRHNLALPRPKDDEEQKSRPSPAEAADDPLASLGKHLYSFLTNPLFESPGVLEVGQAARASRDLDRIIELSEGIKRDGVKPAAKKQ